LLNIEELRVACEAAESGGKIVADYFLRNTEFRSKTVEHVSQGLVTDADIDSERVITQIIRQAFPTHQILGEETNPQSSKDTEHLWIVDPLDGTNNFAHQIPHFAVSIGYYRNGRPHCGVVYNPLSEEWFTTAAGHGAWHNHRRVVVNRHSKLDQTMIAVGFYYDRGQMMHATLNAIRDLFHQNIHGIRRMGTAALDLVQVGLGRFGGYFEYTLAPWDFGAGRLFVEEAGGRVSTCEGGELPLAKSSVLATNGLLHSQMLQIVIRNLPAKL
jgi:myo-inositol-1(or 4)-monophosphatase